MFVHPQRAWHDLEFVYLIPVASQFKFMALAVKGEFKGSGTPLNVIFARLVLADY